MQKKRVGFIGCGHLAQAMIEGMIQSGAYAPSQIKASNPSPKALERVRSDYRVNVTHDNKKLVDFADIVILTVKPNKYPEVIAEIKDLVTERHLIITVAAGVSMDFVAATFEKPVRLIRTMPNIPAAVGAAMTAMSPNTHATEDDINYAQQLFNCVGHTELVREGLMDVVTAISGSSPAIVFMFIEALSDGAVLKGMDRAQSYRLISQAILGAAKMVRDLEHHPGELKDSVTSAGGTSIEALYSLEKNGFRGIIMEAIEKCTDKSARIGSAFQAKPFE